MSEVRDGFIDGAKIKDAEIAELNQSLFISEQSTIHMLSVIENLSAEIAELNKTLAYHSEKLTAVTRRHCDELDRNCELKKKLLHAGEIVSEKCKEIEQLNAKVAMMRGLLNEVTGANDYLNSNWFDARQALFAATEEDVTKFINGVRADALEEVAKKYNTSHATLLPSTHEVADSLRELAQELRGE